MLVTLTICSCHKYNYANNPLKIKEKRRVNKPTGKKVEEKLKIKENSQRYLLIINLIVNELLTSLSKHGPRIYVDSNL